MSAEDEELERRAIEAIEHFIARFSIPIIYAFDNGQEGILGTGTLLRIGNRYFVVTASHLFNPAEFRRAFREEFDPKKLACPDRRSRTPEQPTTFGNFEIARSVQTGFDPDVAICELKDPEKIKRLLSGWEFVTLDQIARPTNEELFFLAGFPSDLVEIKRGGYSGPLLVLRTNRLEKPPSNAPKPTDPNFDIFCKYATHGKLGTTDQIIATPWLGGVSGGSLCQLVPTKGKIWSPNKVIKIVGIQSSAMRDRTWFLVKSWLGVAELLRRYDKTLAKEIERHLGKDKIKAPSRKIKKAPAGKRKKVLSSKRKTKARRRVRQIERRK